MTDPEGYVLADFLPNVEEQRRYKDALRKLAALRPVSAWRLADRARLQHRRAEVARALAADPRFARVPARGPERYELRLEYRHAASLRREATA